MKLKENLKRLRKEKGLTLEQLAKQAGVSKPYLWQLENEDEKKPSADILFKISSVLETTIADLMSYPVTIYKKTMTDLPKSLREFVEAKQLELKLTDEDVRMLAGIKLRGKQPKSVEDWEYVFQSIKRSVK